MRRSLTFTIVAALAVTAGCGSDDDESSDDAVADDAVAEEVVADDGSGDAGDDAAPADDASGDDGDADEAAGDEPAADTGDETTPAGSGTATANFDGQTYQFAQVEPGPGDDWYVFCTSIGDSLQAVFQQVDDAGNVVEGGEISVILLEPGGAYEQTGDPPEVSISVDNERFLRYEEGDPIAAPADGRAGGGTVTLRESGALNPQTGEIETTPVEVSFQVSC